MNWTCLYKTSSRFEAEAIKGNLENEGIACVILNKQDSSYLAFGMVEVHVPAEKLAEAQALIDGHAKAPNEH